MKLKKAGTITKIILGILIIYAVTTLIGLWADIIDAKQYREELKQQIDEKIAYNEELQYAIDNKDDDAVIAGIARDKLGLVEPDEEVFYGN